MTSEVPGRGKRQCPDCKKYVGVRVAVCPCGHVFDGRSVKPVKEKEEGAGRGKRKCPHCQTYIGVRVAVCPSCNHVFRVLETKQESPKTNGVGVSKNGGSGRKQCPECGNYVGVRSRLCACGHEFNSVSPLPTATPAVPAKLRDRIDSFFDEDEDTPASAVSDPRVRHILTPSGKCPIRLRGCDREDVELWAHSLVEKGRIERIFYEVSALKYWVRDFYEVGSDTHKQVWGILDEIFAA